MAGKIKGLTVEIDGNVTGLKKAIGDASRESKKLQSELNRVSAILAKDPTNFTAIAQKQALYSQKVAETYSNLQNLYAMKSQLEAKMRTGARLTAEEARQWRELEREIASTEIAYTNTLKEAVAFGAGASTSTLQAKARYEELGKTVEDIGKKLTVLSAATAYVGYQSIDAAMKFESSFTGVRKTVDATDAQFQELSDSIRKMALEKPIDVNDINYAAELGGQLGIAVENLEQFSSVIADLDVSTNLDLEDASLKLAQFANIAGIGETNFDRLGSVIVDLGNNSATTESKIMNMAMRIAGSGSNIGLSAQEILALATSLSSVGIEAEMGGNAISTIMNRIDKDVALNTETLEVWASTAGMSVEDFVSAWDDSDTVMDAMLAVVDGMAEYRDEGGNLNTLLADMNISYMRQIDTMQRLSRTGDIVNEMVGIANNAWDENIALTREANRRYETTENQLQLVKNNLNECAIQLGEIMLPYVRDLSKSLVDLLQWFQGLDQGTKNAIVRMGAFVTVLGPATLAVGKMMQATAALIGLYASSRTAYNLFTRGTVTATGAVNEGTKAFVRAEAKAFATAAAVNALRVALAGLALIGIASAISAFSEYRRKQEQLEKATDGLRKSTRELDESFVDTQGTLDSIDARKTITAYGYVRDSVDECIESQADLAESLEETWGELNGKAYAIEKYSETIKLLTDGVDENGNATKLNADEQAALRAAVAGMNDIMGTSISVVDAENGVLSENTDLLLANADAWITNAKAQAAAEGLNAVMMQQWENEYNLEQAENVYASAKASADANPNDISAQRALGDAQVMLDQAQAAYDAGADKVEWFTAKVAEFTGEVEHSTLTLGEFVNGSDLWSDTLEGMGINTDDLIIKLSELGFTVSDMSGMSEKQIRLLAQNFDLSAEDMVAAFERAGVELPEALKRAVEGTVDAADMADDLKRLGEEGVIALAGGIESAGANALTAVDEVKAQIRSEVTLYEDFEEAGKNAIRGLVAGLDLSGPLGAQLTAKSVNIASTVLTNFRNAVGQRSPWRTMIQSGRFANEGLAIGLDRYSYISEESASRFGERTLDAFNGVMSPGFYADTLSSDSYGPALSLAIEGSSRSPEAQASQATTNYYMIDGAVVNSTPEIENAFYGFMTELKRLGVMQGGN